MKATLPEEPAQPEENASTGKAARHRSSDTAGATGPDPQPEGTPRTAQPYETAKAQRAEDWPQNRSRRDQAIHLAKLLKAVLIPRLRAVYRPNGPQAQFHAAPARERLLIAGNQLGKTTAAAQELGYHATGLYPAWWRGRRYDRPVKAWAASVTAEATRDNPQRLLYAAGAEEGWWRWLITPATGAIAEPLILKAVRATGGPAGALDRLFVRHVSGGVSEIGFKSYAQGREKWQGPTLDIVWFDEEPPMDIYIEGLTRTNFSRASASPACRLSADRNTPTLSGCVMLTFTPLNGWSDVVSRFMGEEAGASRGTTIDSTITQRSNPRSGSEAIAQRDAPRSGSEAIAQRDAPRSGSEAIAQPNTNRSVTRLTLADATQYTGAQREQIAAQYATHEREARLNGLPSARSGRVFSTPEDQLTAPPFAIPSHWPQIAGMDFGWDHPTAAVSLAWDRDRDVVWITRAYKAAQLTPADHAEVLRSWGRLAWAWPHDGLQHEKGTGRSLSAYYGELGLAMLATHATFADGGNSVELGLMQMDERLRAGRLRVFEGLDIWLDEYRRYRRKDGRLVKLGDDLMAATRYALMCLRFARPVFYGQPAGGRAGYRLGEEDFYRQSAGAPPVYRSGENESGRAGIPPDDPGYGSYGSGLTIGRTEAFDPYSWGG